MFNPVPDSRNPRLRVWHRWLKRIVRSWMLQARGGEYILLLFIAGFIGLLGGLGTIAFESGLHLMQSLLWNAVEPGNEILRGFSAWKIVLIPAAGGLAAGLITVYWASRTKGYGVGEVIRALATRDGSLSGRITLAKSIASVITVGSGGSAGRAGPIVQIGSAIASRMGRRLGMSRRRLRTLVGCGAAAGLAATFNAPIAGALFATEVILGQFGAGQFGPIVISSVTATVVVRGWRGNIPVFSPPESLFASPWELLPYAMLGLLCGLVSFAYIRITEAADHVFDRQARLPAWIRPAIGGLLIGLLALVLPQIMGDGHWLANDAFAGRFPVPILFALALAKIVATALTLGSGGAGGVFAPVLAIGALLGAGVGGLVEPLLGDAFGGVAAYSLVGMAGLLSGTMLAPITAILMVFEITFNYDIILPVMVVSILSTVLTSALTGNLSIYTHKLAREGVRLLHGGSPDLLAGRHVEELMRPRVEIIAPEASAQAVVDRMLTAEAAQFYVVDDHGLLQGAIHLRDARRVLLAPRNLANMLTAADLMHRRVPVLLTRESLSSALAKFTAAHLPELPVVESPARRRPVATLAYDDVLSVYQEEMLKADTPQSLSGSLSALGGHPLTIAPGFELAEWDPPRPYHGLSLAEARLPDTHGLRVILLKRRHPDGTLTAVAADARTVIEPDDTLIVLGASSAIAGITRL